MMQENLNDDIKDELIQAVKDSDWDVLATLRLYEGDVGGVFHIDNLDLSGRYLGDIPGDFLCFRGCNLTNTSFQGKDFSPMSFWSCTAQGIDLRNTRGLLSAYDTDLRGAKFDETTKLVTNNEVFSLVFKDCPMDKELEDFLLERGVLFDFPRKKNIEGYAFDVRTEEIEPYKADNTVLPEQNAP